MTQTLENLSLKLEPIVNYLRSISDSELKSITTKLANHSRRSNLDTFYITDNIIIEPELLEQLVSLEFPKTSIIQKILYMYNPLRYFFYKSKPQVKRNDDLVKWIHEVVEPELVDAGLSIDELVDINYVRNACKAIDKLTGSVYRFGHIKTGNIDVLSVSELYYATNMIYEFDDTVDVHLRWLALKEDIAKEDLICPYCSKRWRKYTRDKVESSKYSRLSLTCKSKECYSKYRSEYMNSLEVNPSQLQEVKRKKAETFKKRYGVDNIFKRRDIIQDSWKKKLGTDNPTKNITVRAKAAMKSCKLKGNVPVKFMGDSYKLYETEASFLNYMKRTYYVTKKTLYVQEPAIVYNINGQEDAVYIPDFVLLNRYIIEIKPNFVLDEETRTRHLVSYKAGFEFIMVVPTEKSIIGIFLPRYKILKATFLPRLKENSELDTRIEIVDKIQIHEILDSMFNDNRLTALLKSIENSRRKDVLSSLPNKVSDIINIGQIEI